MSSLASDIVRVARSKVGAKDWMYGTAKDEFAANTNKCNKFVYDVVVEAGVKPPPKVSMYLIFSRPPTAGEWADPKVEISGWEVVTTPQPGDIVAEAHRYADATGHVGIVVGPNLTVSAASNVGGVIVENDWGFRTGQTPTFRRYTR
ncbi:CHAP domain-containing protein [Singulisphaera acidiphila]|uniref:CHAP domain-containing protein n=1 Tax=Singulisphaera acidiphila TaxID=466153 RepID=UPI00024711EF|nr:CHAP domain-containing protein [Singulisphaera acidiphila]